MSLALMEAVSAFALGQNAEPGYWTIGRLGEDKEKIFAAVGDGIHYSQLVAPAWDIRKFSRTHTNSLSLSLSLK